MFQSLALSSIADEFLEKGAVVFVPGGGQTRGTDNVSPKSLGVGEKDSFFTSFAQIGSRFTTAKQTRQQNSIKKSEKPEIATLHSIDSLTRFGRCLGPEGTREGKR